MSERCDMTRVADAHIKYGFASPEWEAAFKLGGTCVLEKGHAGEHQFDTDKEETQC
jgi:hypothetical protein